MVNIKISTLATLLSKSLLKESKDLIAVEITLHQKGGPEKHLHFYQGEWFFIAEGEFLLEAGNERFHLKPGDSLWVPRRVPHVWAFVGGMQGRLLASFTPASKLEEFFLEAAKKNAAPGPDQNQWRPNDMEWVGPPLQIDQWCYHHPERSHWNQAPLYYWPCELPTPAPQRCPLSLSTYRQKQQSGIRHWAAD